MAISARLRLKHPIVLIHGLGARGTYGPVDYFRGIRDLLREAGNEVFVPELSSWQTVANRARQLKHQLEQRFPGAGKLNLIGHSMGGLDARYLTSCLGFSSRIASVTTIGTPHRGTVITDIALGVVPNLVAGVADRLLSALFGTDTEILEQLTREHCRTVLADQAPNQPEVGYFSATTAIRAPVVRNSLPLFWLSHPLVQSHEGDNDGFISEQSATWGEHIGTYCGDHYAQIGHTFGGPRPLNHFELYADIVRRLRREAF